MYSSVLGIIPCVLLTVVYLSGDSLCGHGSLNTLDKQLLRILQHYPNGIPPAISERLQKVIKSRVQPANTNATKIPKLKVKRPDKVISNNIVHRGADPKLPHGSSSGTGTFTVINNVTKTSSKHRTNNLNENRNVTKALVVNNNNTKNDNKINVVHTTSKSNITHLRNNNKTDIQEGKRTRNDKNSIKVIISNTKTTRSPIADSTSHSSLKKVSRNDVLNKTDHSFESYKRTAMNTHNFTKTRDNQTLKEEGHVKTKPMMGFSVGYKHHNPDTNATTNRVIKQKDPSLRQEIDAMKITKETNTARSEIPNHKSEKTKSEIFNHRAKATVLQPQTKIGKNYAKNQRSNEEVRHGVRKIKIRNGLSMKVHYPKTLKHHQSPIESRKRINLHPPKTQHAYKPQNKATNQGKATQSQHLKFNGNSHLKPFSNLHTSVPKTNVRGVKTRQEEMSTKIFSFSSPRTIHQNVPKSPQRIANPFLTRYKKKKFSLTPPENQLNPSRNSRNIQNVNTQKHSSTKAPNSWKRPVPDIQMTWENKPNKHGQIAPPTNSLYDQRNPTGSPSGHYYYDSFNFQDTFQIGGQYPHSQTQGSSPMWKQPSSQNQWTSNQLQFQNQQNNERLKISFHGSNNFDKSNAMAKPFQNYPGQNINNNAQAVDIHKAQSVSMTDVTPGPWPTNQESMTFNAKPKPAQNSPQQSVVYSNFKDSPPQQSAAKNNQQQSKTIKGKLSQSGRPSVVYSKFEANSNTWNTMNQRSSHSQNNQAPDFFGQSGKNIYTTTITPYLYPAPSPSMFAPPNSQGKEAMLNVPTFTQDTLKGKQNLPGWNAFTTPLYKKQNSVVYSKTPQNPQMNKQNPYTDITIAPNYLFHQEQTSQYPILKGNAFSQRHQMQMNVYGNQGIFPWSSTISPITPSTPSSLFMQQEALSTKSPDQWVMTYSKDINMNSMGKNTYTVQTTIPTIISPNQKQPYKPQQHQQSNFNGFEQQGTNNYQQTQFTEPFQAPLNQNFQQQQQTQTQINEQSQQQPSYQNSENNQQTSFMGQQQQQQQHIYDKQNNNINSPQGNQVMSSDRQQNQNQHYKNQMFPPDQHQTKGIMRQDNNQAFQVQNVNYLAHDQSQNSNQQQFHPQKQNENQQRIRQNPKQNQQVKQNTQRWSSQIENNQYQNQQNSAQQQFFQNQQLNGPNPNQQANEPNQNQQFNGPNPNQQTNEPYSNQQANEPNQNQQFNRPNPNQQTNGPYSNQQANGPNQNQQFNGPNQNQQFNGPNPNQQANGPNQNQQFNGPNQNQQFNGPNPNQQANGPNQNQQFNGSNPNQQANGPNQNQQANGPNPTNGSYSNQQANGPYSIPVANGPNLNQQANGPNTNQQQNRPNIDKPGNGPYQNQQANGPNLNQQQIGLNLNEKAIKPYPNQQANGQYPNQQVNRPYPNQQAIGPNTNQQQKITNINQPANAPNPNQKANGQFPDQQATGTFPNHQTKGYFQNQQANGQYQNQQANEPNFKQQANGPNQNQQTNGQYQNQQANVPNPNQQANGPYQNQQANLPNQNQQANGPYQNQQANAPNLNQQANRQNPDQQANGPNMNQQANGPNPNQHSNGRNPYPQANGPYPNQQANGRNFNPPANGPFQNKQANGPFFNQQLNGPNSNQQTNVPKPNTRANGLIGQQSNWFSNQNQQPNSPKNQMQSRQPFQQQFQPQQQPQYTKPSNAGNNNRNMKIFTVNQNERRQRQLRIPAPAYLTFGVYYPDGSTTEEEHQLAGKHVHTITRYNADKVDHISDYLTMDHTWNTLGLVSQGNNQDTCYVGKLQSDIMKSYEDIVNKTRFSDIPFIEANDKDILYNNVRPIDYHRAVTEVGQFVTDSCGPRANIFLVTRSRHRQFMAGRSFIPPTACAFGPPQHSVKKTLVKCYNGSCQGNFKCNIEYDVCCPKRPNGIKCRKMSIGNFCVIHPQFGYYPG